MANLGLFNVAQPFNVPTAVPNVANPFAESQRTPGLIPGGGRANIDEPIGRTPHPTDPCPPGFFRPCPECPCTPFTPPGEPITGTAGLTSDFPLVPTMSFPEPRPVSPYTGPRIQTFGQPSGIAGRGASRGMDLFGVSQRIGGGAGGGAQEDLESYENPMLAMGSPLLGQNVGAFAGGGKMKAPYSYDNGGSWSALASMIKRKVNEGIGRKQLSNVIEGRLKKRFTKGGKF